MISLLGIDNKFSLRPKHFPIFHTTGFSGEFLMVYFEISFGMEKLMFFGMKNSL